MSSLVQQTMTLVRHGDVVEGVEKLHAALREGWRVVSVRSEAPPDAAPLDFEVQVLLARTPHRHVGPHRCGGERGHGATGGYVGDGAGDLPPVVTWERSVDTPSS
ncbi:MAG: hypothetical protein AAF624_00300 [Bacteroidota bacterium]